MSRPKTATDQGSAKNKLLEESVDRFRGNEHMRFNFYEPFVVLIWCCSICFHGGFTS